MGWWKRWEIVKAWERVNTACEPVSSEPEVTDVELRRMDEAIDGMIGGVWFPTAAFGVSCREGGGGGA